MEESKCNLINCNNTHNNKYSLMVYKNSMYAGYILIERKLCSQECMYYYQKNYICNFCNGIVYEHEKIKFDNNGYIYHDEILIDKDISKDTCYNQKLTN